MTLAILILALVTFERLGELALARRNTQLLMRHGAFEAAPGHYPLIVLLHAAWLGGLWFFAWDEMVKPEWFAVFCALQLFRFWILATLAKRWTTRIIILPGAPLISSGPYRFLKHPNYAVVIGEIAVLPLAFGMPLYALIFSALNAAVLFIRIRAENEALRTARSD